MAHRDSNFFGTNANPNSNPNNGPPEITRPTILMTDDTLFNIYDPDNASDSSSKTSKEASKIVLDLKNTDLVNPYSVASTNGFVQPELASITEDIGRPSETSVPGTLIHSEAVRKAADDDADNNVEQKESESSSESTLHKWKSNIKHGLDKVKEKLVGREGDDV
jgi:hypothetical protein